MAKLTVIVSELLTKKKYGEENYKKIKDLFSKSKNKDCHLEFLDKTSPIYSSFSNSTIEKNLKNPEKVKQGVDEIIKKYSNESAMLLGGPDIIPFQTIKTGCTNSSYPKEVLSDLPYASSNPYTSSGKVSDYWDKFRALTRLPDVTFSRVFDEKGYEVKNYTPTKEDMENAFNNFSGAITIALSDFNITGETYKSDVFAYTFSSCCEAQKVKIKDIVGKDVYVLSDKDKVSNGKISTQGEGLYYKNLPCGYYEKYNHYIMLHGVPGSRIFKFNNQGWAYMPSQIYEINNDQVCTFSNGVIALLNCCYSAQLNYIQSNQNWTEKIPPANLYLEYAKAFVGNTHISVDSPKMADSISKAFLTPPFLNFLSLMANKKFDFGQSICKFRKWLKASCFGEAGCSKHDEDLTRLYLSVITFYGNPNFIMK